MNYLSNLNELLRKKRSDSVQLINPKSAIQTWNADMDNLAKVGNQMNAKSSTYLNNAYTTQQMSNAFNASQAQLNRDFQERMSNTAHQREVQDLLAAGLSPVLSANAGATTPGGAMAQTSDNITAAFGTMANSALNAMSNITQALANNSTQALGMSANQQISKYAADLSSKTQMSITQANNMMQKYVADIQSLTSKEVARIAGEYNLSVANVQRMANEYAAELAYDASIYGSKAGMRNVDANNLTSVNVAKLNNATSKYNAEIGSLEGVFGSIVNLIGGSLLGRKSSSTSVSTSTVNHM